MGRFASFFRRPTRQQVGPVSRPSRAGKAALHGERVTLHVEREGRSFEWLLSSAKAEQLAEKFPAGEWTVTIRPQAGVTADLSE